MTSLISKVDYRLVFTGALKSFTQKSAQEAKNLLDALKQEHRKYIVECY
jgi:penicillin-binding protein-related factor A (putative recombinase)